MIFNGLELLRFKSVSHLISQQHLSGQPDADADSESIPTMAGASSSTVIGLLGGGQLGRMLCEAANPLGMEIAVLDAKDCPAKQVHQSKHHVTGSFKDPLAIRELAAHSDYLTVEIEHVDTEVLEDIAKNGVEIGLPDGTTEMHHPPIHPSYETLRLIQDKYLQKEHFSKSGLPVAKQVSIQDGDDSIASLKTVLGTFGFPFMLKARKGSYDGRGNYKVASEEDFEPALEALKGTSLYAEKWVPFKMELAVMVVRTEDDEGNLKRCIPYPAVETIHEDSICTKVYMPPRGVSQATCEKARELATAVISTLSGRGVYAVEMFVLEDGPLMVNEVAPRPHNSGHYTIEAVPQMSQYQAQLHSVLDLDMPEKLVPKVRSALMLNILGGATPSSHHKVVRLARSTFGPDTACYLHLYGKESKPGRKIGHITMTGDGSIDELQQKSQPFIQMIDDIRQERLDFANGVTPKDPKPEPEQVKPTEQTKPSRKGSKKGKKSAAEVAKPNPINATQKEAQVNGDAPSRQPLVLVTMGSDSDLPVLKAGLEILRKFDVPYALDITSAHRTPKYMMRVADEAAGKGIKVIIAAAGGAAHLPGMLSSETPLPVIGVPVKATHMDGLDSLLSIVQMPRGVPTATVGINNSTNAALLAVRTLGAFMPEYQEKMKAYQRDMEEAVIEKGTKLREGGDVKYLASM